MRKLRDEIYSGEVGRTDDALCGLRLEASRFYTFILARFVFQLIHARFRQTMQLIALVCPPRVIELLVGIYKTKGNMRCQVLFMYSACRCGSSLIRGGCSHGFSRQMTRKRDKRIARVMTLPEEAVERILLEMTRQYAAEHYDIAAAWLEHFHRVEPLLPENGAPLSQARQQLIGAYFTMDYALEAVALFNPSIVEALDQSGLEPGSTRFGLSLRAVGEGHLSSIVFRIGVIDSHNNITLNEPATTNRALNQEVDPEFSTAMIRHTLRDLGALGPLEELLLERLGENDKPGRDS